MLSIIFCRTYIYIRFGYRRIIGIYKGTNCVPLVAYVFLFCYGGDVMLSLSDKSQTTVIESFNSTSR